MIRKTLAAVALLAACSAGSSTEPPSPSVGSEGQTGVSLHNATGHPLAYVAAGEGTLALLDIRPTLDRGEYEGRMVAPGETVPVTDIIGYVSWLGVNFFLYRVDEESGEARYVTTVLAPAAELARTGGVVTITPKRL